MMSTVSFSQRPLRGWLGVAVLLIALFLPMACAMPTTGQDDSMRQTDVALGIQQTLLAQTAAALSSQGSKQGVTPAPATAAPAATDTPVPTATAEATATAEVATAVPTLAATNTTTAATDTIDITKFKMISFVPLSSGCPVSDVPCWKDSVSGANKACRNCIGQIGVDYTLYLVALEPVFIDPGWPSPYLVFDYKLIFEPTRANLGVEFGYEDGTVQKVRSITASSNAWKTETISLAEFKGKKIFVRIGGNGTQKKEFEWMIQQIKIIPDHKP